MSTKSISPELHQILKQLAKSDFNDGIKPKFKKDPERTQRFGYELDEFYLDMSKTHISADLIEAYSQYATDINFESKRESFLSGEKINNSEGRSVLHALLRDSSNQGIRMLDESSLEQARQSKEQFVTQYHAIQSKLKQRSVTVENIIHVGIGGSSLGTQLIFEALKELNSEITVHFIGNIDGHQLVDVLRKCKPESTLVIGVSKTFTTAETLQNLDSISNWFKRSGIEEPIEQFYAVTADPSKAVVYGINQANVVSFENWVGGRYSVWSSVSLSAALVIGIDRFEEFLEGASKVDQHFYQQAPATNVCYLAAMLDHYYTNYLGVKSRAIFAYDFRLRSLVDYLQQLETESNGKDRQKDGSKVDQQTSPVVWGGVGTDVQHSVFQMLHQGTSLIPSEFLLVAKAEHSLDSHHQELLANGLAQTAALLAGQDLAKIEQIHTDDGMSELTKKAKIFSGDRPSSTILLDRLTPKALGALLAFYEHRTFCFGVLTNINSYDQMGVELGKRLAKQVKPLLGDSISEEQTQKSAEEFDSSTLNLLNRIKSS